MITEIPNHNKCYKFPRTKVQKISTLVKSLRNLIGKVCDSDSCPRFYLLNKIDNLQKELVGLSNKIKNLQKELVGLSNKIDNLQKELVGLSNKIDNLQKELVGLSNKIDNLQKELVGLSNKIDNLQKELVGLSNKIDNLQKEQLNQYIYISCHILLLFNIPHMIPTN